MKMATPTAYHVGMALLGRGNLHPGGEQATVKLLEWVNDQPRGLAVDLGAGLGRTLQRLAAAGWDPIGVEPDPTLRGLLLAQGIRAENGRAEALDGLFQPGSIGLVIAESVLYGVDPVAGLGAIRRVLAPAGALVFVDMVWTERSTAAGCRELHDATARAFGIPMASRERLLWADWVAALEHSGFQVARAERLGSGSPGGPDPIRPGALAAALGRRPTLALDLLRWRRAARRIVVPEGWLETWACMAVPTL